MNMLRCEQLSYRYPEGEQLALSDVTVSIEPGEFVLLVGTSGSGKSTFLRALNGLVPRFYGGAIAGEVFIRERPLSSLTQREIVTTVGFLNQDPERQLLLDTVERELAFPMENVGIPYQEMRGRLAEISHLFGLGSLLACRTEQLSGGEKQRVALASLLTLYPEVLLLDEPTSQLDPVHADDALHLLRRLHEEWGLTIIMSEHRLERCFHLADRILLFEQGTIRFDGTPRQFAATARSMPEWRRYLPPVAREMAERRQAGELPLTVREARSALMEGELPVSPRDLSAGGNERPGREVLAIRQGTAGYEEKPAVLRRLDYVIREGERIALLGENGAGKSTLAKVLAGAVPLASGELYWCGAPVHRDFKSQSFRYVGYLSQNPNDYFLHDTVEAELAFAVKVGSAANVGDMSAEVDSLLKRFDLTRYRKRHPHDLSGGERQRLALAIVLAGKPDVLLLDEPTRGLDFAQKQMLAHLLRTLPVKAVLVITHDVEFAQDFANRVSVLYGGSMVTDGSPEEVFSRSFAYAPQMYRVLRNKTTAR
jgi:energy-coupling factor transporter ATP-binding protein EcfA2